MEIKGTQQFAAPPATVWAALHDAGKLQHALPGAEEVSWLSPSELKIRAGIDVGPIKGSGEVRAHIHESSAPSHLVVNIVAEGRRLNANSTLAIDLAVEGTGTALHYAGTATLGGAAVALDTPVTRPIVDRVVAQFFSRLQQQV